MTEWSNGCLDEQHCKSLPWRQIADNYIIIMCRLVNVSINGDVRAFMFWFISLTSLWHTQNTEITAFSPTCSPKHMAPVQATSASCLLPWLPLLPHFWSEVQLATSYRWAPGVLLGSLPDALPSPQLASWSLHSLPCLHISSPPPPPNYNTPKSSMPTVHCPEFSFSSYTNTTLRPLLQFTTP